ncbi:MAG: sulfide/dihydroorotate dehydrogenase-like FAD/NAD-binding protein [Candidatus Saccharicenans sp.]|nr:sulfide/dihydroorotate dehydrogenase-like FAD/NAD-binding protein [Candidatus Saccharicenans sp.]MDH7574419.1 sulfide/dihydroorotate dehydrogenase-like FAD/NAD-binding protein [Candidatus Saccharicenans sp.]
MNRVVLSERLVPNLYRLVLEAPEVASAARAGQFVMVIPDGRGERIPINLADWDRERGTVDLVFLNLGASTRKLAALKPGEAVEGLAGPLGRAPEVSGPGAVLLAGGCYGIGGLYPLARELKQAGRKVIFLAEARSPAYLYWEEKIRKYVDEFLTMFREDCLGSGQNFKELVGGVISKHPDIALVMVMGCSYLLFKFSEATTGSGLKTLVSLNPIMVDGTGMCGACRVSVGGRTYFACVDGPWFEAGDLDWQEYFNRRKAFLSQEEQALARLDREFWKRTE